MIRWATNLIGSAGAPLAAKVGLGLVAVIGLQFAALALLWWQFQAAQRQLGASAQQLAQCRADNQTQTQHIRDLGAEIQRLAGEIEIREDALAEAATAAEDRDDQRAAESAAERKARAEIYDQQPECQSWATQLVCVQIADRMIERRNGLIQRWGPDDE